MDLEVFSLTHPGLVRQGNEDAIAWDTALGLAVLADGMGGYKAGEIASRMAIDTVLAYFQAQPVPTGSPQADIDRQLIESVEQANASIWSASQTNPDWQGMGTTLVMGVFTDERLTVCHVGDSRAYRWRDRRLQQLTVDHSLLQQLIDQGLGPPELVRLAVPRSLVTRALGVVSQMQPELVSHPVLPQDVYLLCSDGLTDMIDDDTIADLLAQDLSLEQTGQILIDAANAAGGRDNISVMLVRCLPES